MGKQQPRKASRLEISLGIGWTCLAVLCDLCCTYASIVAGLLVESIPIKSRMKDPPPSHRARPGSPVSCKKCLECGKKGPEMDSHNRAVKVPGGVSKCQLSSCGRFYHKVRAEG